MQDLELDKKILSYAFKDKKSTMELTNSVNEKYFAPELQWVFKILVKHFTDPKFKEIPTRHVVSEHLDKTYNNPEITQDRLKQFDEIHNTVVIQNEFSWHLDKFRARYNAQIHSECAKSVQNIIRSELSYEDKIERANKVMRESVIGIDSIYRKKAYKEASLDENAHARWQEYTKRESDPDSAKGILTGFKNFDRITNGLHKGELMVVAGSTGTGKSIVMHNIGVNAYLGSNKPFDPPEAWKDDGCNVLYFSLEMPHDSMTRRIDSCMGGLYLNQIRDGVLSAEDKQKYCDILKFQKRYQKKFHIIDMPKGATAREVELKYNEICESKFKPDLVIIDYIGIMSPNEPGESDWLSLGKISADLHEFARTYEVPVVTGSQVNRPKEGPNGKVDYSTNRIARSDTMTTNCNIIVQIGCRDDEYVRTDMPIYIVKMRDGEKGSFTLSKDFSRMKVVDMVDETFANGSIDDDDI